MKVSFNKTKIIATYGPACADKNKMSDLVHAGVDVFRFNFSHGSHEQHLEGFTFVKELAEELNINIGILADLQGPKIRLGKVRDNHEVLETGQTVEITNIECVSTFKRLYVSYDALPQESQPGEK
ncbi:MAG TPA: pyruvate kinase, partial [Chitinophagales bacterium]|nr:pyruvate kinase [Chitinophagales bacterium]